MAANPGFGTFVNIIRAAQTAAQQGVPFNAAPYTNFTVYLTGTGTITSGVITVFEAAQTSYGGTWSTVTTQDADAVSAGAVLAIHLQTGAYRALRVDITTLIGGGGSLQVDLAAW